MIKTIYLAGGCFWCTEAVFQRLNGVRSVIPGYIDGFIKNPAYREVCSERTGHTEAISVDFEVDEISLVELLLICANAWFSVQTSHSHTLTHMTAKRCLTNIEMNQMIPRQISY